MKYRPILLALTGPTVLLVIWQIAASLQILEPSLLSSPGRTLQAVWQLGVTRSIFPDIGATLWRMALGYSLAAFFGTADGLLLGVYPPAYKAFGWMFDFFRSTPVTTLYPIFVLLLGINHSSKIAMVFWASFFVIVLNAAYGAQQSSHVRWEMARLYGASRLQVFRWIVFFDSLPQIMIGLRVGLSYALIVEILCEMFMGSEYGLGQRVTEAYTTYSMENLYAIVLITGTFGYLLNRLFVALERRIVPWVAR